MAVKDIDLSSARAIRSPVRTRILEILVQKSPQPIKDVAAKMGKSPVPLYHHFKVLVAAGLLREAGTVGAGRKKEVAYATVSRGIRVQTEGLSRAQTQELAGLGAAHARYALRKFLRAVGGGKATLSGQGRDALVRHLTLSLTPERLSALNRDLDALVAKWIAAPSDDGAPAISLAIIMGPQKD